ncbi:hypothetical protein [Sphingomonas sp. ID0503]|uniref:hypothetical protein n=1 Tax=Sphingomonas sp. ID0503 TaxID=3399691 RepID=UPI003AFA0E41
MSLLDNLSHVATGDARLALMTAGTIVPAAMAPASTQREEGGCVDRRPTPEDLRDSDFALYAW